MKTFIVILTICLGISSCSNSKRDKLYLSTLNDTICKVFYTDNFKSYITNGTELNVLIANTTFNDMPIELKQEMARNIGKIALTVQLPRINFTKGTLKLVKSKKIWIFNKTINEENIDMGIEKVRQP